MLKRILIIGAPNTGKLRLTQALCGSPVEDVPSKGNHAGLIKRMIVKTPYYEHDIPIWIDEFYIEQDNDTTKSLISAASEWASLFCGQDAAPVREILGAIILTIKIPKNETDVDHLTSLLQTVQSFLNFLDQETDTRRAETTSHRTHPDLDFDTGWEGIKILVGDNGKELQGHDDDDGDTNTIAGESDNSGIWSSFDYLDNLARSYGLEYVELQSKGENEYGETTGVARILEALQAFNWHADSSLEIDSTSERILKKLFDDDHDDGDVSRSASNQSAEHNNNTREERNDGDMTKPLLNKQDESKFSNINSQASDDQQVSKDDVDRLEMLMSRVLEIRQQRHNMTPQEQKKNADWLADNLNELI